MHNSLLRVLPVTFCFAFRAAGQVDEFSGEQLFGWTLLDPIGEAIGEPFASADLVNETAKLSAGASPAPEVVGPSRVALLRQGQACEGEFEISIDFEIPVTSGNQSIGLLGFLQPNPAVGQTSGYSLNYQPRYNDLIINRIENEVPTLLARDDLPATLPGGTWMRLVFFAEEGQLEGTLYRLSDLESPLLQVSVSDQTYTSGMAGIFLFDDSDAGNEAVEVRFDRYQALRCAEPKLEVLPDHEGGLVLRWPDWVSDLRPVWSQDLGFSTPLAIPAERELKNGFFVVPFRPHPLPQRAFFRLEPITLEE